MYYLWFCTFASGLSSSYLQKYIISIRFQIYFRPQRFRIFFARAREYAYTISKQQHTWAAKLFSQAFVLPGLIQNLQGLVCLHHLSRRFRLAFEIGSESNQIMLSLLM